MHRYILCHRNFSKALVEAIEAATPAGWHITKTVGDVSAVKQQPNTLFIMGGSKALAAAQTVRIRMCGSSSGPFDIKIGGLAEFFNQYNIHS